MNTRAFFSVLFDGLNSIIHNISVVSKGQASNFAIIQQAHKLEKGLSIREPRRLWGYDNAKKLADFIGQERLKTEQDSFALQIGISVLNAYIVHKLNQNDREEQKKLEEFKSYIFEILGEFTGNPDATYGGTVSL